VAVVEKPLFWIGSSKKDLLALPADVVRFFGHALDFAQHGDQHAAAKTLKGFGGGGVLKIVESNVGGTYRAVYTVKFEAAVFVLHCFQKKTKSGIATPKKDMDVIHARLKVPKPWRRKCEMENQMIDGIEVEAGSGNVFADLNLADSEKLKVKSGLVIEITRALRRLDLTQEEAGRRMGVPQPKVSAMLRGDFTNLSERKLMECLNRLGYDIEIKVKRAAEPVGHLTVEVA
jgi:phage-related protein/predicted XRE-type DNA-binding protein